jgi:hypothetical protein
MSPGEEGYRCKLRVRFLSPDGAHGEACKWVDLPFVPTAGMQIGGMTRIKTLEQGVEHVGYLLVGQVVWIPGRGWGYFVLFCGLRDLFVDEDEPAEQEALKLLGDDWCFEPDHAPTEAVGDVAG